MVPFSATLKILGRKLPRNPESDQAVARGLVDRGLPASTIDRLAVAYATTVEEIQRLLGVSRTTGKRQRSSNSALRPLAADRALRLARVLALTRFVLEDDGKAARWLKERNRALRGERPIDLLATETGTDAVEELLGRIEYGIFS
ncbi:MAG: DUF2384 domain-containing protein [Candidatus Eremiobacteraeota bacterium]|nr:DUF2384 domain-containing protein [Candidatus Eremiobacteraeota bacterium]